MCTCRTCKSSSEPEPPKDFTCTKLAQEVSYTTQSLWAVSTFLEDEEPHSQSPTCLRDVPGHCRSVFVTTDTVSIGTEQRMSCITFLRARLLLFLVRLTLDRKDMCQSFQCMIVWMMKRGEWSCHSTQGSDLPGERRAAMSGRKSTPRLMMVTTCPSHTI